MLWSIVLVRRKFFFHANSSVQFHIFGNEFKRNLSIRLNHRDSEILGGNGKNDEKDGVEYAIDSSCCHHD